MSLYDTYRPQSFADMEGDFGFLTAMLTNPKHNHTFILTGNPGTGKTTAARILAHTVHGNDQTIIEHNCAADTSVESIRTIIEQVRERPLLIGEPDNQTWVVILDEVHKLSSTAQNALLKDTESVPDYVYWILSTSEFSGIIPALKTRGTVVRFPDLDDTQITHAINRVLREEDAFISKNVKEAIVKKAGGCARDAINYLEQILGLNDEEKQLIALKNISPFTCDSPELTSFAYVFWNKTTPAQLRQELSRIKKSTNDCEGIRRALLNYGMAMWLSSADDRILEACDILRTPTYTNGFADLAVMCFRAMKLLSKAGDVF